VKVISISGIIGWDVLADNIRKELASANGEDVRVEISSPGGFVFEGLAIYNLIKNYAGNVTTHLMGLAASMASYIALAGQKVTAEDNAVYMIHNVSSFAGGDHRELRKTADVIDGLSGVLSKAYSKKSGKSVKAIREMMDEETYLYGKEIVDAGFIDEVVSTDKDKDRDTDVLNAMSSVEACVATVKENEKSKHDLEKAAACITGMPKEEKQQGANMKTLSEFLASCAEAKAEFDKAIEDAKKAVHTEWHGKAKKIAGFLTGKSYPASATELAMKVLNGETEMAALEGAVIVLDAQNEAAKAAAASKETKKLPDTQPDGNAPAGREDGVITSEDEFRAEIERKKAEKAGRK
jgi:ATP-dependent Clp endopeptidase proteolytic subunit ClpP